MRKIFHKFSNHRRALALNTVRLCESVPRNGYCQLKNEEVKENPVNTGVSSLTLHLTIQCKNKEDIKMNRLVVLSSLILSLLIVSAVAIQAEPPLPLIEDFEAYGENEAVAGPWTVDGVVEGASSATIVGGIPDAHGKCLKMDTKEAGVSLQIVSGWEGPSPDRLITEYRLMVSAFPPAGSIVAMLYITPPDVIEADKWGEGGMCIAVKDETLLVHSGAWTDVQKIESDKWYTIKYDIDTSGRVFDIYIDGQKQAENCPFRGETATAENLTRIWIFAREPMTVFYDDILVYDAAGPVPTAVNPNGKLSTSWGELKSAY